MLIVRWVRDRTSALMSAAQQMAMSTGESSSTFVTSSLEDAMMWQLAGWKSSRYISQACQTPS